jgi:threonine aldolase
MMGEKKQQFASDNYSGMCPEALEYFHKANTGHDYAYGDDKWTKLAADKFREIFEVDCEVFFVFNGTAANSLALASLCQSYHSVISHEVAHVETDECGAPEFFSHGIKILLCEGEHGKMGPEGIERIVTRRTDIHYPKPRAVSLTQATEVGTVYTVDDLLAITDMANQYELRVHMDGARFANAVVSSGMTPRQLTEACGIDVLCFGGVKNGLAAGEAIIFFDKDLAFEFDYRCKQAGQLSSKMRFIAAPWLGILENGVWLQNARHANDSAARLEEKVKHIPGVQIMFPREANSLFLEMPVEAKEKLEEKGWHFYSFIGLGGARFMCSWDTEAKYVDALAADIEEVMK